MDIYNAFISLWLEHGVYIKDQALKDLDVNIGDYVWVTAGSGIGRGTIEQIGYISEVDPRDEAFMLLSLLDHLAKDHYYFLAEFGFTENVSWVPKQYGYVKDVDPAFESLDENRREYKGFKAIYSYVERNFIDFAMSLEGEYGADLITILSGGSEEEKKSIMKVAENAAKLIEHIVSRALLEADLVIGAGTFLSIFTLPIETAFLVSGPDTGSLAIQDLERGITVNPFLIYWLLSSMFRLEGGNISPVRIPIRLARIDGLKNREIPMKELTVKTYSPSKTCVKAFYLSERSAVQWAKEKMASLLDSKPYLLPGDLILPFTCPSRVRKFELVEHRLDIPYVDATPYGRVVYESFVIPKLHLGTDLNIEFFANPLYDKSRPLVLDTNVISIMAFPYKIESPFFEAFINGRKVVIPAIVVYELKRKLGVGREKRGVTRALTRLREISAMGLIDLEVSGELPPDLILHELYPTEPGKGKKGKAIRSDLRDSLILLETLKHKAILFSNDSKLRQIALMLGVPSISYNSLLEDVKEVVSEMCKAGKVHKNYVIKNVKTRSKEVREEEYTDDEIVMALTYLIFSGIIKFEGDYILYVARRQE